LRLEDYLRVNDGELRNARRVISYWNSSSTTEKKNMLDQVARMVRTRANQLDLYTQIKHLL
jgi:dimeric dUTPase (all-alpha-NTP-PPase superfamily)